MNGLLKYAKYAILFASLGQLTYEGLASPDPDRLCLLCFSSRETFQTEEFENQRLNHQLQRTQSNENTRPLISVSIEKGESLWDVATKLQNKKILSNRFVFVALAFLNGIRKRLKYGHYQMQEKTPVFQILKHLIRGHVVIHKITIPEGLSSFEIQQRVNKHPCLSGKPCPHFPEGTIVPSSFWFQDGSSPKDIFSLMKRHTQKVMMQFSNCKIPKGLKSHQEVIILASIVEKEARIASERPLIAGVFLNRLRKRMHLNADPTIIYALTKDTDHVNHLNRSLSHEDMKIDSPFNTYRRIGLPPTPICCPGIGAISDVYFDQPSPYLYFVAAADGSGRHRFSSSAAEHNKFVNQYKRKVYQAEK